MWWSEEYMRQTAMPFGKHEGEEICDLPVEYAKWCLENLDLDGWLEEELESVVGDFDDYFD